MKLRLCRKDLMHQNYPKSFSDSSQGIVLEWNGITSKFDYLISHPSNFICFTSNFKSATTGEVKVISPFSGIISKLYTPVSHFTLDNTLHQDQVITYDFVSNQTLLNYQWIEESTFYLEIDDNFREKPKSKSVSLTSRKLSFEYFFHNSNYNVIEENFEKIYNLEEGYHKTKPQWKDTRNDIFSYAKSLLINSPDYFVINIKRQSENLNYVLFVFQTGSKPKEDNEIISCIESKNFKKNDKKVCDFKKYTENNYILLFLSFYKHEIDVEFDFDNYDCLTLLLNNYQDVLKTSTGILLKPYQS